MVDTIDMQTRRFIRHPSDIPIEYCFTEVPVCQHDSVANVSAGGLSFHAQSFIKPGQWLTLRIQVDGQCFEMKAQVKWCESAENNHGFHVGVQFSDNSQAFSARMVEQICHIEHYKNKVRAEEGRILTAEQAAAEWIEKFAQHFPKIENETDQ